MAVISLSVKGLDRRAAQGGGPSLMLPGATKEQVAAQPGKLVGDILLHAAPDGHQRDHRADADDDAQHGQDAAQLVGGQRAHGNAHRLDDFHGATSPHRCRWGQGGAIRNGRGRAPRERCRRCPPWPARSSELDQPIADAHHALAILGRLRVVRDEDDGDAPLLVQPLKEFHDLDAGLGVQVAGRLVGQDHRRPVDQRAGDGDALLLAAGEFVGLVVDGGRPDRPASAIPPHAGGVRARQAGVDQRQFHICQRRRARQQVEALKDKADLAAANIGQRVVVEPADILVRRSRYCPSLGTSRQPMMFISVDLPLPLGPMMATISPGQISRSTPRNACTSTSPIW
jgi:hypothetical protein